MTTAPATATAPTASLLVVDDDEMNRHMLSLRLRRRGYTVTVAEDGHEALELIARQPFDLVLLDWMMPGLSGLDLLQIVRRTHSVTDLPIIMTTALTQSEDLVRALELGANDYVTKPLDFPVVLARIQAQLQMKRLAHPPEEPGRPANAAPAIGPGTVLSGRYRLEALLGEGGAGSVYRATHLPLGHAVAVKVLRPRLDYSPDEQTRFLREGIAGVRIKHPNAVAVLDFGVTPEGVSFLVMELLEGYSLADELRTRGRLTPARCAAILTPICDALTEAHATGIIHRDLKPANIFLHQVRGFEIVKVVDFGIAKLLDDAAGAQEQHLTLAGHVLGTPAYMAPERLQNRPYDGRADVYSLGIMLYLMLTGVLPFQSADGDPLKVALMQIHEPPLSLRAANPDVPAAVEAVVLRALAKDPAARSTPAGLAADFARAAAEATP